MAWPKDTPRKKTSKARGKFTLKFDLRKKKKKRRKTFNIISGEGLGTKEMTIHLFPGLAR